MRWFRWSLYLSLTAFVLAFLFSGSNSNAVVVGAGFGRAFMIFIGSLFLITIVAFAALGLITGSVLGGPIGGLVVSLGSAIALFVFFGLSLVIIYTSAIGYQELGAWGASDFSQDGHLVTGAIFLGLSFLITSLFGGLSRTRTRSGF